MPIVIGVDVSKASLDICLLRPGQPPRLLKLPNKLSGFSQLNLLAQESAGASAPALPIAVAMEATGVYHQQLAEFCFQAGWTVFVLNPRRVKAYGVALGQKNKTDRADARTIALFAEQTKGLKPWSAPSAAQACLRQLVRERLYAQDLLSAEKARRETTGPGAAAFMDGRIALLQKQVKDLWRQIRLVLEKDAVLSRHWELLSSIPGVGAWTAAFLLSELPAIDRKTSPREIASLFGLCPRNAESGTSVRGRARVGGQGRRRVSHQLYLPALAALKHNPVIAAWAKGLRERAKTGKEVICAAIHRLMRIAVGVLKTQTPFDPAWSGGRPA